MKRWPIWKTMSEFVQGAVMYCKRSWLGHDCPCKLVTYALLDNLDRISRGNFTSFGEHSPLIVQTNLFTVVNDAIKYMMRVELVCYKTTENSLYLPQCQRKQLCPNDVNFHCIHTKLVVTMFIAQVLIWWQGLGLDILVSILDCFIYSAKNLLLEAL